MAKKSTRRAPAAPSRKKTTTRKKPAVNRKPARKPASANASSRRQPARSSSARAEKAGDLVRLNKLMADHGVASRRACDELITKGKVTVDGQPVTALGTKVDPLTQVVEIGGVNLKPEGAQRRYYLLNKPSGVVCTNERNEQRPRAVDLIKDPRKGRIYTVGRLDEESKGLILLTNDGEFAQRIAHPRFGVEKTYMVKVRGKMDDAALQKIRGGVHLSEGKTGGARILVKKRTHDSTLLSVTLREGMNREIRRVFARVGFRVTDLKRTDIGPLTARGLKIGHYRSLNRPEVESLLSESDEATAREPLHTPRRPMEEGEEPARPAREPRTQTRRTETKRPGGNRSASKRPGSKRPASKRPASKGPAKKGPAGKRFASKGPAKKGPTGKRSASKGPAKKRSASPKKKTVGRKKR